MNENKKYDSLLGGMTNDVFKCEDYILRVYGKNTHKIINRDREINIMNTASKIGLCPKIIKVDSDERVEEYIDGDVLSIHDMFNEDILKQIVVKLKELHAIKPAIGCIDIVHERIKDWSAMSEIQIPYSLLDCVYLFDKEDLVLCHGDLTHSNIIKNKDGNIVFIDLEYSGYSHKAFDIAGLFCEMELGEYSEWNTHLQKTLEKKVCLWYENNDKFNAIKLYEIVKNYKKIVHYLWFMWAKIMGYDDYADLRYHLYIKEII